MTTSREHRYALPTGHRLGEYRIDRYLGSGGFGITYLATDENLDLQVAIKEYLPSDFAVREANHAVEVKSAADREDFEWGRERFLDEARSLARFDHPNIVGVQRFLEAHGTSYIVMDYVEGEPLSELLKRKGTLTEAEIRRGVLPIADGLAEVHRAGLLHRDVKPGNIIVRTDGAPVLIDFGAARLALGAKSRSVTSVVTPGYAPPEQYSTKSRQKPATDIYALGAVLYRCVTGRPPDDATDRLISDEMAPASQAATDGYSKSLLGVVDAALKLRMEDRPESVAAFLGGLDKGGRGNSGQARRQNDTPPVAHRADSSTGPAPQRTDGKARSTRYAPTVIGLLVAGSLIWLAAALVRDGGPTLTSGQRDELRTQNANTNPANDQPEAGSATSTETQEQLAEAKVAYERGDYATALPLFRNLAAQGVADAQFHLGILYVRGEVVSQDYEQAADWYRRAAEQGHAEAQFELGYSYHSGFGVPQDHARAAVWYRRAAEQGNEIAQNNLGLLYSNGKGVPKDYTQAADWYRRAAGQGYVYAQSNLGYMYRGGEGVPQDHAKAAAWYRKAAEQGYARAQFDLGLMYANGEGVPQDHAQAAAWYHKAAKQGNARAQLKLGLLYHKGEGVPQDHAQAGTWFRQAAKLGPADAQVEWKSMSEGQVALTVEYLARYASLPPDEVYAVVPQIREAVRERDLTALLDLADRGLALGIGPPKVGFGHLQFDEPWSRAIYKSDGLRTAYAAKRTFGQLFDEEWRSSVLQEDLFCSGPDGCTFGNGKIWFAGHGRGAGIYVIHRQLPDPQPAIAPEWRFDGRVLGPNCFGYRSHSWKDGWAGNVEAVVDLWRLGDTVGASDFMRHTGIYLGDPIKSFDEGSFWGEVSKCAGAEGGFTIEEDAVVDLPVPSDDDITIVGWYRRIAQFPAARCKRLAPSLPARCMDAALVETAETSSDPQMAFGSMGSQRAYAAYGLFELDDGRLFVLPLMWFDRYNEALDWLKAKEEPIRRRINERPTIESQSG